MNQGNNDNSNCNKAATSTALVSGGGHRWPVRSLHAPAGTFYTRWCAATQSRPRTAQRGPEMKAKRILARTSTSHTTGRDPQAEATPGRRAPRPVVRG